jgi:hypothetical protein
MKIGRFNWIGYVALSDLALLSLTGCYSIGPRAVPRDRFTTARLSPIRGRRRCC